MSNHDEVSLDVEELYRLCQLTTRPYVRQCLQHEADKLQSSSTSSVKPVDSGLEPMNIENSTTDAVAAAAETSTQPSNVSGGDSAAVSNPCIAVTRSAPQQYYKEVTTYAWDQSDKFMKLYVTLKGVQRIEKELVKTEYTTKSFSLRVENLDGSNYVCRIAGLWGNIIPDKCYHRVKTDTVLLMLKKAEESKTWSYVTEREDKKKTTPKLDEQKDPSEGLMDLLKKMYEDGDDEMKRTIAKSWCESRSKQSGMDL